MRGLSLVVASGGHSSSRYVGLSLSRPLLLQSTGSRRAGSVIVAHGSNCSAACGIFPDQGSNPCPLHWQADSQPLCHQGSPHRLLGGGSSSLSTSCPSLGSALITAAHARLWSSFRRRSESPLLAHWETKRQEKVACLFGSCRLFPGLPPG